jgi:MFS family permease
VQTCWCRVGRAVKGADERATGHGGVVGRALADQRFLGRVTAAMAFGEGLDGYDLGVISVVLPLASTTLHLTTVEEGLLGASSLAGIFFGAPIFGRLTDRFGRRKIFILDLVAFVILGGSKPSSAASPCC